MLVTFYFASHMQYHGGSVIFGQRNIIFYLDLITHISIIDASDEEGEEIHESKEHVANLR